ncbi:MAG: hypothetical protein BWZ00_00878 [Bacteroidetes bacterium ADurb.BinA174]|jgi:hypothetical protein|nr:MAG: hypothetical protein BWZ00_00878 [Bacteroidetes bacterium ADurb.BinA174]
MQAQRKELNFEGQNIFFGSLYPNPKAGFEPTLG